VLTDLDAADLWRYRSEHQEPDDFDDFWRAALAEAAGFPLDVRLTPVETDLATIDVFDVTFAGAGGDPIRAWLRLPRAHPWPLPAIVQFHGYGSGRGHPLDDLLWASAGYAHLLMDVRGQGGGYAGGDTGDPAGSGPSAPGFLTRGIESPLTYFYRRVFVDAVRALHVLRQHPAVDAARVGAVGASQGGGIALAVAGLVPDLAGVFVQAPFLADIRRATLITGAGPYQEIRHFLAAHRIAVDRLFGTLGYFDAVGFARRAAAPAWFSTGLMDDMCPPSTAFGAYHAYAGPKQIKVWEYNGHDAGGPEDLVTALAAFRGLLKETSTADSGTAP
jgi:cephalosporin-C deacetylase